jgi:MFS family permease
MEEEKHIAQTEEDPQNLKAPVFTKQDESKLVRKLDFWLLPIMMFTYVLQSYDKGIMSAATQFNFDADLGLTKIIGYNSAGQPITDNKLYSNASFIFYVGYLVGTYPMMYLSQKYPTSRVLGLATFFWAIVVMSTAACHNYPGIMLARFVLGVLESTVAPAFTVYITFWWTREEQVLRSGLWYCCVGVATTIGPLINYGLGQIHGALESWKYLFLVLGAITCAWSFVIFFVLPDSPLTTKGLTEFERTIAIDRLQRNNAGTYTHSFNRKQFFEAFRDYKLYSSFLVCICTGVPSGALGTFATLVINGFGFSHFASLALTCPIGGLTAISILFTAIITRIWKNSRYIWVMICALISTVGTLICWVGPHDNKGVQFFGIFLISCQVASQSLVVSLVSSNIAGHTKKATVSGATFVGYCVGNVSILFGCHLKR